MRFEIYEDAYGGWHWHLRARNRTVIATCAHDYTTMHGARRAARRVRGRDKTPVHQLGPYTWQNRRLD